MGISMWFLPPQKKASAESSLHCTLCYSACQQDSGSVFAPVLHISRCMMVPGDLSLGDRAAPPAILVAAKSREGSCDHPCITPCTWAGFECSVSCCCFSGYKGHAFLGFPGKGAYGWLIHWSSPHFSGSRGRGVICVASLSAIHRDGRQ